VSEYWYITCGGCGELEYWRFDSLRGSPRHINECGCDMGIRYRNTCDTEPEKISNGVMVLFDESE